MANANSPNQLFPHIVAISVRVFNKTLLEPSAG
jgi:hypothetical protein